MRIPGMMFGHDPDYTHHTSEDTPDKVDPVQLERCEILAAGIVWYLANLDDAQAEDLAALAGGRSAGRLGAAGRKALAAMQGKQGDAAARAWAEARNQLDHALQRELQVLASVLSFRDTKAVRHRVEWLQDQLSRQHQRRYHER